MSSTGSVPAVAKMSQSPPDKWVMEEVLRCLLNASADKLRDAEWSPVMEFADFPWVGGLWPFWHNL